MLLSSNIQLLFAFNRVAVCDGERLIPVHRLQVINRMDESTATRTFISLFDQIWKDVEKVSDVTELICDHIASVYKDSPQRIYLLMLRRHMAAGPFALEARSGEGLERTVECGARIRGKRRECKQLEAKLRKELQFNRKVEIKRPATPGSGRTGGIGAVGSASGGKAPRLEL